MSTTVRDARGIRFHLSLNVSDLARSVEFYRAVFGAEPAKCRADYAKFEADDPPLVLSLEPTPRGAGGALNHLGFRLPDAAALVALQERLERAGLRSQREEGVECCYARQTKFWLHDPDGTLWEFYTLDEDIDHRGAGQVPDAVTAAPAAGKREVWEHVMGTPLPQGQAEASVDEVRLRGSLNVPLDREAQDGLVRAAWHALRPGGRVFVHTLVAERPLSGPPQLPGPAAAVQYVPPDTLPSSLLAAAGFQRLKYLKFDEKPCFVREGVALREQQLEAHKP